VHVRGVMRVCGWCDTRMCAVCVRGFRVETELTTQEGMADDVQGLGFRVSGLGFRQSREHSGHSR